MPLPPLFPTGIFTAFTTPLESSAGTGLTDVLGAIPSSTNPPIIFEPYWTLTDGIPEVWILLSGDETWGGALAFVSLDNTTYGQIGTITRRANQGLLTSTFASGANPDTVNTLAVDLTMSLGSLISGTVADANFEFPTLAYCDGELISFSTATLTSANHYDLTTYIRRGGYHTTIASHASGTQFGWIQAPFAYAYPVTLIGNTVWFKFPAFNRLGAQLQDLGACTAYPHVLTGFGLRPLFTTESHTTNYIVLLSDNYTHFDNCGATGDIIFTLPLAAPSMTYSFMVCEPFYVKVQASGSDIISRGSGDNSATAGYIRSNLPYSLVTIEAHHTGSWVVSTQVGAWSIDA